MTAVFCFELKYWASNRSTYLFIALFFAMGWLLLLGNAGYFEAVESGLIDTANSPYRLWKSASLFFKLLLFIVPATVGYSAASDFIHRTYPLIQSFPIRKINYALAKYLSILLIVSLFAFIFLLGFIAATLFLGTDHHRLINFNTNDYAFQFFVILLPNILIITALVYQIVYKSQQILSGYFVIICIFILKEIFSKVLAGTESNYLLLMLDPFADFILQQESSFWNFAQQNSASFSCSGSLIFNRILWLSLSIFIPFIFSKIANFQLFSKQSKAIEIQKKSNISSILFLVQGNTNPSFIFNIQRLFAIAKIEYLSIVRTTGFQVIIILSCIFLYLLLSQMNTAFGIKLQALTWRMLAFPMLFANLFIHFISFLYAGILINRDISYNMQALTGTTPVKNSFFALSKLISLSYIQLTLLLLLFLVSIGVQISSGSYSKIELFHYFFDLIIIHFPGFVIWNYMAIFIHQIIKNNWLAVIALVLFYFGNMQLDNYFIKYNASPYDNFFLYYSDFTGYSHALIPFLIYKLYWFLIGLMLFISAISIWRRTYNTNLINRIAIGLFSKKVIIAILTVAFFSIIVGIFVNKNESNKLKTSAELAVINKIADERYAHLYHKAQPRINRVILAVDIYPEQQQFEVTGSFWMINKSLENIDSLIITKSFEVLTHYQLNCSTAFIKEDSLCNIDLIKLEQALVPGDSLQLTFSIKSFSNSLFHQNTSICKDGTYLTSVFLPSIGYKSSHKPLFSTKNNYRNSDADGIFSDITISTTQGQTPIATGNLIKSWKENGRNYAHFVSDKMLSHDYCFLSGEYALYQTFYDGISIEIYHHPTHKANIDNFVLGIKETLKYGKKKYDKYAHKHLRLVEFPRNIGEFAQSFAGVIPYSELGFIIDVDEDLSQNINLPFLGAAHELAHQWWGMQVIPADTLGTKFITEGMAEFTAYRVYKEFYGEEKAALILNKANARLSQEIRASTENLEVLQSCTGDQTFIAYQKAVLNLNALYRFMGEDNFDSTISNFYRRWAGKKDAPYCTALDFIAHIKAQMPSQFQALADEYVETNSFYNNFIQIERSYEAGNDSIILNLLVNIENIEGVSVQEIPIEIGFYDNKAPFIPNKTVLWFLSPKKHSIQIKIHKNIKKIMLDPYYALLDLNRKDNILLMW